MRFLFLGLLWLFVLTSSANAWDVDFGSGQGGCCGGDGSGFWWPDAISRAADRLGFNGQEAKEVYDDLLSLPYADLSFYFDDEAPCETYGNCGGLSDKFFKRMIASAMKYHEVEYQYRQLWWTNLIAALAQ